jgi:hypothetical protein
VSAADRFDARRREVLGWSGGAMLAGSWPASGAAPAGASVAPAMRSRATQASVPMPSMLDAFTKIRADLGGRTVVYWYRGYLYAYVVDRESSTPVPLMGVEGLTFTRHERTAQGWRQRIHEVGYYTDFHSHEPLEELRNPVTGREVRAVHYRSQQVLEFGPSGILFRPRGDGSESFGFLSPPITQGEWTWVHEHIGGRAPPAAAGAVRTMGSVLAMYSSPTVELLDPALACARCTTHFEIVGSFHPWLGMGALPGHSVWAVHGVKLDSPEGVSPWLLQRIARDHPDYLVKPQV